MTDRAILLHEIETLPASSLGKIVDFVANMKMKKANGMTSNEEIDAYKAMAADKEREQEASEWCNAYFGVDWGK